MMREEKCIRCFFLEHDGSKSETMPNPWALEIKKARFGGRSKPPKLHNPEWEAYYLWNVIPRWMGHEDMLVFLLSI